MIATQDIKEQQSNPKMLSPLTLAFLGDAVFELLVRERLASVGSQPANILHKEAIRRVCAEAQADAYVCLESFLNEEELSILKRGRNANSTKIPKHASPSDYRKATGVEALFGYLYLKGEIARINELFDYIEHAGRECDQDETASSWQ